MRRLLPLSLLAISSAALAQTPPAPPATKTGVDGLCGAIAEHVGTTSAVSLQVEAEGPAVDIAENVRARCAALFPLRQAGVEPRVVHVQLRVAGPALTAFIENDAVSVPLGGALETWLAAGGHGLETWLVGSVEGSVLALCGADGVVALVMPSQVAFVKWNSNGLTPLTRMELPPPLRTRARAPAASAVCRGSPEGLTVAIGIHDRGKGAVIRFANGTGAVVTQLDGIPIGLQTDGTPTLIAADSGTNALKWKNRTLAQASTLGTGVIGVTPAGALVNGESMGATNTFGTGFAAADLDHDGTLDLVVTRPVFSGAGVEDRLSVRPLENPATVVHESRPVKGLFGAVGTVTEGNWIRVLAAEPTLSRTQLFAVGLRQPPGTH